MGCACSKQQQLVDVELRIGPDGPFAAKGALKPLRLESFEPDWHDAMSVAQHSTISSVASIASVYHDCLDDYFDPHYCVTPHSPLHSVASGAARLLALTETDSFTNASTVASGSEAAGPRDSSASGTSSCGPWSPRVLPFERALPGVAPQSLAEAPVEYALRRYKQGDIFLCRTVAELLSYHKSSGLPLDEIERILLEAELRVDAAIAAAAAAQQQQQQQQQQEVPPGTEQQQQEQAQDSEGEQSAAAGPSNGQQQQQQQQHTHHQQHHHHNQQPKQQQQQYSSLPRAARPGQRWVPTTGDCLTPGVRQLPTEGLGIGGADLYSAAHVMGHLRAAVAMLDTIESSKSWKQVSHGALQIWHHHDKQREAQEFRVQCVIEEALLNMISICREVDLSMAWNPTISIMKTICQASMSEVMVYLGLWYPWPLSEPELQWRCLGIDLLSQEGGVLVTIQDLGETPASLELPPSASSRTRYRIKPSCMKFSPIAPDPVTGAPRMDATIIARLDTRTAMIPDSFLSFLMKVFAPLVYRNVVSTCRRLFHRGGPADSALTMRQRERFDLYYPQARSIDRYLRSKGWSEQIPILPALAGARLSAGGTQLVFDGEQQGAKQQSAAPAPPRRALKGRV